MAWIIDTQSHPLDIHVMPLEDLRPHGPVRHCWCRPEDGEVDGYGQVVIHKSLDGRERYESGELLLH
jgi:hypothetical protein